MSEHPRCMVLLLHQLHDSLLQEMRTTKTTLLQMMQRLTTTRISLQTLTRLRLMAAPPQLLLKIHQDAGTQQVWRGTMPQTRLLHLMNKAQ